MGTNKSKGTLEYPAMNNFDEPIVVQILNFNRAPDAYLTGDDAREWYETCYGIDELAALPRDAYRLAETARLSSVLDRLRRLVAEPAFALAYANHQAELLVALHRQISDPVDEWRSVMMNLLLAVDIDYTEMTALELDKYCRAFGLNDDDDQDCGHDSIASQVAGAVRDTAHWLDCYTYIKDDESTRYIIRAIDEAHADQMEQIIMDAVERRWDGIVGSKMKTKPIPVPKRRIGDCVIFSPTVVDRATFQSWRKDNDRLWRTGQLTANVGTDMRATIQLRIMSSEDALVIPGKIDAPGFDKLDIFDQAVYIGVASLFAAHGSAMLNSPTPISRIRKQITPWAHSFKNSQIEDVVTSLAHLKAVCTLVEHPLYDRKTGRPLSEMYKEWTPLLDVRFGKYEVNGHADVPCIRLMEEPVLLHIARGIGQIDRIGTRALRDPGVSGTRRMVALYYLFLNFIVDARRQGAHTAIVRNSEMYAAARVTTSDQKKDLRKKAVTMLTEMSRPQIAGRLDDPEPMIQGFEKTKTGREGGFKLKVGDIYESDITR